MPGRYPTHNSASFASLKNPTIIWTTKKTTIITLFGMFKVIKFGRLSLASAKNIVSI